MKTLFYNGIIYDRDYNKNNSMIIENDKIIAIADDLNCNDVDTKIDLLGKTILPSFLDAHSHITSIAMSYLQVDLGSCTSINEIKDILSKYYTENKPTIINAINYDHNKLIEKRHPTKDDIDDVIPNIPVVLSHNSNHFGVLNTKAIKLLNVKTANGFLQETDFVNAIRLLPLPSIDDIIKCYKKAQDYYASYGICYVQDGMIVKEMLPIYQKLLDSDLLYLDIFGYPAIEEKDLILKALDNRNSLFKIKGYKIILDGSPQGKTAYMLTPYLGTNDCSSPLISDEKLEKYLDIAINDNKQLIAHCNGDHASLQFINACKKKNIESIKAIKPVIIHGQLLNVNQLDDVKKLGIIPSFFIAHVYYFGDIHIQNFGLSRASKISPAKSCLDKDILFTFHQDSPVINPNMFETIQISVNRLTKNNILLGSDEQISLKDALDAVTKNVARQYGIEDECGYLAIGMKASFIIIDKDIFACKKEEIKDIKILETYKNGKCIYTNNK